MFDKSVVEAPAGSARGTWTLWCPRAELPGTELLSEAVQISDGVTAAPKPEPSQHEHASPGKKTLVMP